MDWLVLFLSLGVVTIGAEGLVQGASSLALRFGVSPLFVGLTIVGFGTSSPELSASVVATLRGSSDVSVGNVIGSNIFNIGIIVGLTALIHPIRTRLVTVRRDLIMAIAAASVPWLSLMFGFTVPRLMGAGLVTVLTIYLAVAYRSDRRVSDQVAGQVREEIKDTLAVRVSTRPRLDGLGVNLVLVVGGLLFLVFGSRFFVISALNIARAAGMSELLIGLTVVSVGTSLPELITSVVASLRGNTDIAVGNIIGSNIFNIFGILGVSSMVHPQNIGLRVLVFDVSVMMLATLALVPMIRSGSVVSRREGLLLLGGYGVYLTVLVLRGA